MFFHERKSGKQHASTHGCGFHNWWRKPVDTRAHALQPWSFWTALVCAAECLFTIASPFEASVCKTDARLNRSCQQVCLRTGTNPSFSTLHNTLYSPTEKLTSIFVLPGQDETTEGAGPWCWWTSFEITPDSWMFPKDKCWPLVETSTSRTGVLSWSGSQACVGCRGNHTSKAWTTCI